MATSPKRKPFLLSQGVLSRQNWHGWSFVNHATKVVIFGAWTHRRDGPRTLILKEAWQRNANGRKSGAYTLSREHIRLVEEEGYLLQTFPQIAEDPQAQGPMKLKAIVEELTNKVLVKDGGCWYAVDAVE